MNSNWEEAILPGNNEALAGKDAPTLEITGKEIQKAQVTSPRFHVLEVDQNRPIAETLFEINAKLARLTKSKETVSTPLFSGAPVSRREFLSGLIGRRRADDIPIILQESCEAKYGCAKCVDACPAPGALNSNNRIIHVSSDYCIRCGLCAGVCPVAAIQIPEFTEDGYIGLLDAVGSAPERTLVLTCDRGSVPVRPWIDVEEIPGIGAIGLRQLALAANSSIGALVIYCPDGQCPGKEHVRSSVALISNLLENNPPIIAFVEGEAGVNEIVKVHESARPTHKHLTKSKLPWKNYVESLKAVSGDRVLSNGLGFTNIEVADTCTLCYGCVESCPHKALEIDDNELIFHSSECTGCGYCEEICPEHSITLLEMNGPAQLAPRTVYSDESMKCSRCNTPYASAKLFRKVTELVHPIDDTLTLCPKCRQETAFEKVYGNSSRR